MEKREYSIGDGRALVTEYGVQTKHHNAVPLPLPPPPIMKPCYRTDLCGEGRID